MAERPTPTILITRPEEKAHALKLELEARGYRTLIEPMLTIEPLGPMAPPAPDVQALALTSANAVPALGVEAKELPVFTVGRATADAARAAGCRRVIVGGGDAAALAALIGATCRPEDGAIVHAAGEVVREDLRRILNDRGFELRREIVYRALPSAAFSDRLLAAWRRREIAAALLFSPRTAETLVRLLIDYRLASHVDTTTAICVSEATATPCRRLDWRTICLAARPDREALIRALEGSIGIC